MVALGAKPREEGVRRSAPLYSTARGEALRCGSGGAAAIVPPCNTVVCSTFARPEMHISTESHESQSAALGFTCELFLEIRKRGQVIY